MNRDEAREILTNETGWLSYHVWTWFGTSMGCPDGCCDESYDSIEEALDAIARYAGQDWSKVDVTY